jgi:hypothetical protein
MSLAYFDGYDTYNGTGTNTGVRATWIASGQTSTSLQTGRFGGRCLRFTPTNAGGFYQKSWAGTASCSTGIAIRFTVFPDSTKSSMYYKLANNDGDQIKFKVDWQGKLYIFIAGSTLTYTSPSQVIFLNTWHYLEVECTLNAGAGVLNVYLDGVSLYSATGLSNKVGSTSTVIDAVRVGIDTGNGGTGEMGTVDYDDLYIKDDVNRLGERRVQNLYPASDVSVAWSRLSGASNYLMVNEAQVDGDTSYIYASSVGNTDTYTFDTLAGTPAVIDGVQMSCYAYKTDAATRKIALQVKSGATTSDGSDITLTASYGRLLRLLNLDPNGSISWTYLSVNALQGGPKVTV